MRTSTLVLAMVLALTPFRTSVAAPHALYNPATGNVQFVVDTYVSAIYLLSASGSLRKSEMIHYPGITSDDSEFPFAYIYLGLHPQKLNTGSTVIPGSPASDLTLEYYDVLGWNLFRGEIVVIPEPAALTLAAVGVVALLRWQRR